jgi:hypothetical protein
MKKSLQHFVSQMGNQGKDVTSGYLTLKNITSGTLLVDNGTCTKGDYNGINKSNFSNTGDCSKATKSRFALIPVDLAL